MLRPNITLKHETFHGYNTATMSLSKHPVQEDARNET